MIAKRLTPAAAVIGLFLFLLPSVAEAGIFGRIRDAGQIILSEGQARRGWVIFEPVPADGGDLVVLGISVLTHDPTHPAFLVRFQATDAGDVMAAIRVGHEITVRKFTLIQDSGSLPTYMVEPKRNRGWRSKAVPRASPFFAQWAYLVSCRALSGYPEQLKAYFDRRPDLRTLCERDVRLMYGSVFGSTSPPPAPTTVTDTAPGVRSEPVIVSQDLECEADLEACTDLLQPAADRVEELEAYLRRMAGIVDSLRTLPDHAHHGAEHIHVDDARHNAKLLADLIEQALEP